MVFNWFRRQYDEDDKEKSEPSRSEQEAEQTQTEIKSEDVASAPVTTPQSQDLLNWAKAAYTNIQQREAEQLQQTEPKPESSPATLPEAAIAPPETEQADLPQEPELIAEAEDLPTAQPLELAGEAPVELPIELPVEPLTQVAVELQSEPTLESSPEIVVEAQATPLVETGIETLTESPVAVQPESQAELPIAVQPELAPATTEPESTLEIETAADASNTEITTETAESQPETSSLPFWAQSDTERQARIAELAANAIAEVEEEPAIKTASPAIEVRETQVIEPELPFDEGFLWSAEILAAQGRRPEDVSFEEITWLRRLRQGLDKTRLSLINQLKALVGQGPLNADAVDEIEALLLQADVGVKATDLIIQALQDKLRQEVLPPDAAIAFLKQILGKILDAPLHNSKGKFGKMLIPDKNQLNVWLITGVNGAGKTTTIGKLAHIAKKSGYSTLIAAADTFRAAAVQQVQVWGDRSEVEVIANTGKNTDPAAVVFDAIIAAQARGTELLLVDTAGRLQNKKNLMDELSKIRRIVDKKATGATVESLLVLDATLGQNGLRQAEVFSQSAGISGVVLTKLDGTAKGGVALAVVQQLGLPIRFIGAGEGIEDLRPFSSYEFVEALLSN